MTGAKKKGREGREKLSAALWRQSAPVKQRGSSFLFSPVPSPSFFLSPPLLSTSCSSLVQRLKFDFLKTVNSWTDFVCATHTRRHVACLWKSRLLAPLFDFLDSRSSGINFIFTQRKILCKDNVIWLSSTVTY